MKHILAGALMIIMVAGCSRPGGKGDVRKSAEPGVQAGEMYDSGGFSLTNPIVTNDVRQTEGTNSGVTNGVIRVP